ncbi:MAG TPA: S8 family serine peptidase [Ilumatobacter sp.]|nr:S8 family serine peptidase [Ilumatobacter sp.]
MSLFSKGRAVALAGVLLAAASLPGQFADAAPGNQGQGQGRGKPVREVPVSTTGSYIVVLNADPLLGSFTQDELQSNAAANASVELVQDHDALLDAAGVSVANKTHSYVNSVNGFSATMSHESAVKISLQKNVAFVVADELMQPTTDESGDFLGLTDEAGAWDSGLLGEDIVIGVIDSGIWPEHASFADDGSYGPAPVTIADVDVVDEDGEVVRVIPGCDFGGPSEHLAPGLVDAPFECNDKLIGARQMLSTYASLTGLTDVEYDSARDENGHGTHTASTAGGNAGVDAEIFGVDRGTVSGIAPLARIVAYKALGELGGYGSDLTGAIDQAVEDGVDVINYSIGSSSFAIGSDDVAFLFAANAGVFVATSNGNAGPGAATTGSPASVPWITSVGASTHTRTFTGSVTFGDLVPPKGKKPTPPPVTTTVEGASVTGGTGVLQIVDAADHGNELCLSDQKFKGNLSGKIVLCKRGVNARVDKSFAVYLAGGAGMVLYNLDDVSDLITDNHWVPSVHVTLTDGLVVKSYIDTAQKPVAYITGGEHDTATGAVMAAFSSRGENLLSADIIKPDVTAPGVNILAGQTPTPTSGPPGQLFQSISGTSMSSPHVAGLFALIKQAHPDWSPAMAKSALMTTSYQDVMKEDAATPADPFDMGAGHVDPSGATTAPNSLFNPGIVYDNDIFGHAAFTCGADLGVFTAGTCDFVAGLGYSFDATDLNLASIGIGALAGTQTTFRTITNVSGGELSLTPVIDAPAGFSVSVDGDLAAIAAGESRTFDITIARTDAAVGVWGFGSITLEGSGYEAYSPIAVRATNLAAVGEVTAALEDGTASIPVAFGYTGEYTPVASGLVAATDTVQTVGQDPDQTFAPSDEGNGATRLDVAVTAGDTLLRVHLPQVDPDDNIDLDLYVYGPDGTLVGASGNGGTNETVELLLPVAGTYELYTHGWGVGDASPVEYTIQTWLVPGTPGNLEAIDPGDATVGTSGEVIINWPADLPAGEYYGVISHVSPDGLEATTLVALS